MCVVWQIYYGTSVLLDSAYCDGTAVLLVCVCSVANVLRHSCFTGLCVLCGRRTTAQLFYWSVCVVWQMNCGTAVLLTYYDTSVLLVCVFCMADVLQHNCFTGLCVLCDRRATAQLFYWSVCDVWQTYYGTAVLLVCVLYDRHATAQLFYRSVCVVWQTYYGTAALLVCVLYDRHATAQLFYWSVCVVWQTYYGTAV